MTEEELRAICKGCRERYPNWDCWGCPNYADVELVQHEQSQADRIEKLEAELEQVKRERDAAVKDLKDSDEACEYCANYEGHIRECNLDCYGSCKKNDCKCNGCRGEHWQWRGVKEG